MMCGVAAGHAVASYDFGDTRTQIFSPDFRTLKVGVEDDFMAPAVIAAGGDERIVVSFDELTTDRSYLCYSLYHCNADWQPSMLLENEYLSGFNKADVEDIGYSRTTFMQYVNYRIVIPDAGMQPLASGNYLLRVYREDDPDDILLQARFGISEEEVPVEAQATIHTDMGSDGSRQQVEFSLDTRALPGVDPFTEVVVTVEQNSDPNSAVTLSRPLRVEPSRAVYAHNAALIFPSGNEWRRFETVRADYPGLHADSARYDGNLYAAYLTPDIGRADKPYLYDETQFGRFMVREYNSNDSDTGADYIDTRFTLDFPRVMNARIFLDGEFTGHMPLPAYELHYDPDAALYKVSVPLKQGSYNYRYVAVAVDSDGNPSGKPVASLIEGDKAETVNEYTIRVFLRKHGARADRLVGRATIFTTL